MKILEKYILKENFKPFTVSLVVITFVMLLDKVLDLLNLIIEKHLDFPTIVKVFGLSLPFMLALSIPMAVLMASIISFGRLSTDNELTAFKSCGINIYRLIKPTVITAFFISLFMIYFNNEILPNTNHSLKNLLINIHYKRPATEIKVGIFNKIKDLTIFIQGRENDIMKGMLIYDNKDTRFPRVISAKTGKIILGNGGNSLKAILNNGEMIEQDKENHNKVQVRKFKKFVMNLPDLGYKINDLDSNYRGDREMTSQMLLDKISERKNLITKSKQRIISLKEKLSHTVKDSLNYKSKKKIRSLNNMISMENSKIKSHNVRINEFEVEYHKKFAIAFACLIFVLIGIPVGIMTKTSSIGTSFTVSSIVFLVYYSSLVGGEELADRGLMSPFLSMWIANFVFGVLGIFLVYLSRKEDRTIPINKLFNWLTKKFSKVQNNENLR